MTKLTKEFANDLIKLDEVDESDAIPLESADDTPAVGTWWWVKEGDGGELEEEYDEYATKQSKWDRGNKWLACIVEVGSNYVKLRGVRYSLRLATDDIPERCERELDPNAFIDSKVDRHRKEVRKLMGEIQRVCQQLGVPFRQALAQAETPTMALAVAHGVEDVKKYSKELVKAKDKTLPELFEKVKVQHAAMATWMKAELIPAEAELTKATEVTKVIEHKIHTVELYAGLQEKLVQIREGDPAKDDTKVVLLQRMHFMDEECLFDYKAGGMDFKRVVDFDKWMARDENMTRLLPHERCIIAMRVRRYKKEYGGEVNTLANFITFGEWNEANMWTFLYIRNGRQLWRMHTSVEFDESLFPNREDSELLGDDELWVKPQEHDWSDKFISGRTYHGMVDRWKQKRAYCAQALWQWHRAGCPGRDRNPKPVSNRKHAKGSDDEHKETRPTWKYVAIDHPNEQYDWKPGEVHEIDHGDPRGFPFGLCDDEYRDCDYPAWKNYHRLTPESIYYDDAMKKVAQASFEHNRIAVIIQGLLDRSTCLHPHPPWRIWTPEGFAAGIELVYDVSRALTPGEQPDWEGYWKQLNKSVKVGSTVIGQKAAWAAAMQAKYGHSWNDWEYDRFVGDGPKYIDTIKAMKPRTKECEFTFTRARKSPKVTRRLWGRDEHSWDPIPMSWWCPKEKLFCVDAYTPGDYHMFFDDPRTRAEYLKWAPYLLAAEDWHGKRRSAPDKDPAEDE